jgi:hypothetical protein
VKAHRGESRPSSGMTWPLQCASRVDARASMLFCYSHASSPFPRLPLGRVSYWPCSVPKRSPGELQDSAPQQGHTGAAAASAASRLVLLLSAVLTHMHAMMPVILKPSGSDRLLECWLRWWRAGCSPWVRARLDNTLVSGPVSLRLPSARPSRQLPG